MSRHAIALPLAPMLVRVPFKVAGVGTPERHKHDLFALTHRHYWQSEFLTLERHVAGRRYTEHAVWDGRHCISVPARGLVGRFEGRTMIGSR